VTGLLTRLQVAAPWLALLAGFSPVLADLARNLRESPEDACFLLPAVLLVPGALGARAMPPAPLRRDGILLVAAGAALEILGIATGSWSLARLGLPLAALGVARLRGAPPPAVMALGFLAVPIPDSVLALTSPALESALARAAAGLLHLAGVRIEVVGFSLLADRGRIDVEPSDTGLPLAVVLAAVGWFGAIRRGSVVPIAARQALGCASLALPIQVLGIAWAGLLSALGADLAAWSWLKQGLWVSVALGGLGLLARRPRPARVPAGAPAVRR
jgi:hypothetical protein